MRRCPKLPMMSGPREARALPRPVDVEAALLEAIELLRSLGADCALIGGVALGFHGVERFTKDVDLAVAASTSGRVASRTERDPRPLNIGGVSIATASGVRVDFIDRRLVYAALYEEAIAAARTRGPLAIVRDRQVPVVLPSHLIAMKLAADRPQDEIDVEKLLAQPAIDYAETRAIVERHLGPFAAQRLDKVARKVGRADAPRDYAQGS